MVVLRLDGDSTRDESAMPHAPVSAAGANRGRLVSVFVITLTVLVVEVIGGILANSLVLLADAGHMFTDVAGIGVALGAVWFAAPRLRVVHDR